MIPVSFSVAVADRLMDALYAGATRAYIASMHVLPTPDRLQYHMNDVHPVLLWRPNAPGRDLGATGAFRRGLGAVYTHPGVVEGIVDPRRV